MLLKLEVMAHASEDSAKTTRSGHISGDTRSKDGKRP